MPTDEVGRVGEQTGPHRVALSRDRVGPGARTADVAGHERHIDDGLRCACGLMPLIDSHGPPEGDALTVCDRFRELEELLLAETQRSVMLLRRIVLEELAEAS